MLPLDPSNWQTAIFRPESKIGTTTCLCNSGIPRVAPQSVGDASVTDDPGSITGGVPIFRPVPWEDQVVKPQGIVMESAPRYTPGGVSDTVPFDPKTNLMYYGVV